MFSHMQKSGFLITRLIWQFIPVTSLDTKIDYRNVYCARCNGELGKLDAYDFATNCGTVLEAAAATTFADVNDIISKENCEIKIEMPYDKCNKKRYDTQCHIN